jgi:hypothetical protein
MSIANPAEKLELAGVFLEAKSYFSALRCVYTDPELLGIMLNSIKMAIGASNADAEKYAAEKPGERGGREKDATGEWHWREGDRNLFCMQFVDLAIVQNYTSVRDSLEALGQSGSKVGIMRTSAPPMLNRRADSALPCQQFTLRVPERRFRVYQEAPGFRPAPRTLEVPV